MTSYLSKNMINGLQPLKHFTITQVIIHTHLYIVRVYHTTFLSSETTFTCISHHVASCKMGTLPLVTTALSHCPHLRKKQNIFYDHEQTQVKPVRGACECRFGSWALSECSSSYDYTSVDVLRMCSFVAETGVTSCPFL